jgi:cytochrome c-type biogenesis protein CcmH
MTIFWILAAGLLGLASLFVALPLLKRTSAADAPDQDELNLQVFRQRLAELDSDLTAGFLDQDRYEAARRDLERELLYDLDGNPEGRDLTAPGKSAAGAARYPWLALGLVLLVSAGTVLAYLRLGERDMIQRIEAIASGSIPHGGDGTGRGGASLEVLVQGLAERMEKNPDNLDGWLMLGRTYFAIGQGPKALEAVERAYGLAPEDTTVLIAYAEAIAANSGNRLDGRPAELIRAVLDREPGNPSARWLKGMLAYQQERFAEAAETWQAILDEMDPAGEEAGQMRAMIAEALNRGGLPTSDPAAVVLAQPPPRAEDPGATERAATETPPRIAEAAPTGPSPLQEGDVAGGTTIQVAVSLDPGVAAQAGPEDSLFVYARAASGPPMPLAVQRFRVSDLPVTVTLDDSMAMMPALRLSAVPQVVVGARISKTGQATPQPGDLEGQTGPIGTAETPSVAVTIDRVRP